MLSTITNAIPCTFWALVHIYRDSLLLSEIRAELKVSTNPLRIPAAPSSSDPQRHAANPALSNPRQRAPPFPLESLFSTPSLLLQQPLLQSVYAEILRLYVRGYITRSPSRSPLIINTHIFPKKSVYLASSDTAHFDPLIWNTRGGSHPISIFWASRFLVRRGDPIADRSGELRGLHRSIHRSWLLP